MCTHTHVLLHHCDAKGTLVRSCVHFHWLRLPYRQSCSQQNIRLVGVKHACHCTVIKKKSPFAAIMCCPVFQVQCLVVIWARYKDWWRLLNMWHMKNSFQEKEFHLTLYTILCFVPLGSMFSPTTKGLPFQKISSITPLNPKLTPWGGCILY